MLFSWHDFLAWASSSSGRFRCHAAATSVGMIECRGGSLTFVCKYLYAMTKCIMYYSVFVKLLFSSKCNY